MASTQTCPGSLTYHGISAGGRACSTPDSSGFVSVSTKTARIGQAGTGWNGKRVFMSSPRSWRITSTLWLTTEFRFRCSCYTEIRCIHRLPASCPIPFLPSPAPSTIPTGVFTRSSGRRKRPSKLSLSINMLSGWSTASGTASIIGPCGTSRTSATGTPSHIPKIMGSCSRHLSKPCTKATATRKSFTALKPILRVSLANVHWIAASAPPV